MPCLLIIEKTGSIKELNVKTYAEDELYKKAGFKNKDGFELKTSWDIQIPNNGKKYFISVYGKVSGRAGQENKYDFPPPIDKILFFGSCVLVNHPEEDAVGDITKQEWSKIYEQLFGGFEDIGSEDSSDDEDDIDSDIPKTKSGYAKDGFVVDDVEESEESEESSDELVEEVKQTKKSKKLPKWATKPKEKSNEKPKEKPKEKTIKKKKTVFETIETETPASSNTENTVLECSDELKEEEYL
jgi:hypothetical protein